VSLILRIALPAAMLVVLIYTLNAAARELRAWNARLETPNRKVVSNIDAEPVTFTIYPVQHGDRIQDVIALQWPAFLVAGTVAPVPRLSYSERRPKVLSWASYVTLPLAVGLYWFAIAVWIDKRLIQRKSHPFHSRSTHYDAGLRLDGPLVLAVPWQGPLIRLAGRTTRCLWSDSLAGDHLHNPVDRGQWPSPQSQYYSRIMKRKVVSSAI
jgi:hypothetical protein